MKNEFVLAFNEVLEEKQLPRDVVMEALEAAMASAYRRAVNASNAQHVEVKIDPDTGRVEVFAEKEVVDVVQDERTEVALEEALSIDPATELGGMIIVESTPKDFGRVAAQTARQVIQQRIREAERDTQLAHYGKQMGEIVNGVVQAVTPQGITLGLDMKAEGILPRIHMVPGERFRVHDRVQALLLEVKQSTRGPQIILSRAHRNFLRRLLENEVPEIYHGLVEIRSIAREPGQRSKVAVYALQPGVDPVGACVGIRGVRIQAIVRELHDEKIDVIEWDADPSAYIAKALSPARVIGVYLNEHTRGAKTATVVVPEDQLSLAIGRDGQNARLAAKLTSWRIDIKSLLEAATDAIHRLQTDPAIAFLVEKEADFVPRVEAVLTKKLEGRPITPEEFQMVGQFVDRIERGLIHRQMAERKAEDELRKSIQETIPEAAFSLSLEELALPERLAPILSEAGYQTAGDIMLQMALDSDAILALDGIGPKAMEELQAVIGALTFPEPEVVVEQPPAEEAVPVEAEAVDLEAKERLLAELPAAEMLAEAALPAAEALESVPEAQGEVIPEAQASAEVAGLPEAAPEVGEIAALPATEAAGDGLDTKELPFDEIFSLSPDVIELASTDEEFDEDDEVDKKQPGKKKKKKKKFVEVEYDPDKDVLLVKHKRKRGGDWEGDW